MIILGVDVETTGLDVETDEIIELGLVVYETSIPQLISLHSDLYKTHKWSKKAENVHNITYESSQIGYDSTFNPWFLIAKYEPKVIVAHNAEYDKSFVVRRWSDFGKLPWICTDKDLPHEDVIHNVGSTRLQHLAVDYELVTNKRHRAAFDALLCCEMASRHNLDDILALQEETQYAVYVWYGGKPNFEDSSFKKHKEYLKQAGFKWDGKRWNKKNVPASRLQSHISLATATKGWKSEYDQMNKRQQ